MMLRFQI